MKDPLQLKPTPYEILEIDLHLPVDKRVIETQFKKNFNKKGAREARNTLNNPLERALIDVFFYEDSYMERLMPQALENPLYLVQRRQEISEAWFNHQQKYFPYYPLTFHLALLWYWWAVYIEEKTWADAAGIPSEEVKGVSPAPDLSVLWKNTIIYWVCLINSGEFWQEWFALKRKSGINLEAEQHLGPLQQRLQEHFINHFHTFSERYRLKGDIPASQRYREYELWFSTELKTAADISRAGIGRTIGGKKYFICCGRMLLEKLQLLENFRTLLKEKIAQEPDNHQLKDVAAGLSPHAHIRILINQKKYDEALKEIGELPESERENEEILQLKALCCHERGKQLFSIGQVDEAFRIWGEGLKIGEMDPEIKESLVTSCKEKAVLMQKGDPDSAISMLEKAITIVPHLTLKQTLSAIFLERGIQRMNRALKKIPRNTGVNNPSNANHTSLTRQQIEEILAIKQTVRSEAELGLRDMQKAVELDSMNHNAREQLKIARNNFVDIDLLDIYKAFEVRDLGYAGERLNQILLGDPGNARARELLKMIKTSMCWFCKNRQTPNPPDESAAVEIKMYKETSRDILNVNWQILTIKIPRCRACLEAHKKSADLGVGLGCITGIILSTAVMFLAHRFSLLYFILAGSITSLVGGIINRISAADFRKFTHKFEYKNSFPLIKEKEKEGWKFGEKPPDIQDNPRTQPGGLPG